MSDEDAPQPRGGRKPREGRRPKAAPKKHASAARPAGAAEPAVEAAEEATLVAAEPAEAVAAVAAEAAETVTAVAAEAAETVTAVAAEPAEAVAAVAAEAAEATDAGGAMTAVTGALRPVKGFLTSQRAPRLRRWLALILVVMSVVGLVVSALALWSDSLVFNTDRWVATVAPVAEDPAVRHSVSTFVADKTLEVADLQNRIANALPSDAAVLAQPLTQALRDFLIKEIDKFLATPTAQRIWVDVNRFAHEQLITALQDKNKYVAVNQNDVTLNLLPLIGVALQRLEAQIPKLLGKDVQLPRIDPTTAPEQIRTLLQDATGMTLPADFGTVTLLKGSQGYEAKQALRLFHTLVIVICVVTALLIVAALLVSPRKRWTALELGLGVLLAVVIVRVAERQIEERIVAALKNEGALSVAEAFLSSAISSLNGIVVWLSVGGVIVAVAAFLATRPAWVEAMGRGVSKLFGVASDLTAPETGAGRWAAAHIDVLRVAGVALAVIVLMFMAGSLSAVIVIVLVLIVYELALAAFLAGVPRPGDGAA